MESIGYSRALAMTEQTDAIFVVGDDEVTAAEFRHELEKTGNHPIVFLQSRPHAGVEGGTEHCLTLLWAKNPTQIIDDAFNPLIDELLSDAADHADIVIATGGKRNMTTEEHRKALTSAGHHKGIKSSLQKVRNRQNACR